MRYSILLLLLLSCAPKYIVVGSPDSKKLKELRIKKVETIIQEDKVKYRIYYK